MQIHDVGEIIAANKEILDRFPFLWPTDDDGNRIPLQVFQFSHTSVEKIPPGWQRNFGHQLLESIRSVVERAGRLDTFLLTHLGGAGGRLVIGGNEEIDGLSEIFDEFVYMSERICAECGGAASHTSIIAGLPICTQCKTNIERARRSQRMREFAKLLLPEWRKTENGKEFAYNGRTWEEVSFETDD